MCRSRHLLRGTAVAAAVVMAIGAAGTALAGTGSDVHVVASFDESMGQNTEGVAVDRRGNVFVSVSPLGDLWKIPAGSTTPQPFAHVDGIVPGRDFGMLGLATDARGNVYAAVQSSDLHVNGVWRFRHRTAKAHRLPGTKAIHIPNGLAFDRTMKLYVTDSTGAIWRVRPAHAAEVWLEDWRLRGNGSLGLFLGANGIAVRRGSLVVTNTERRTLLRIWKDGGEAGAIRVVTRFDDGRTPDGVQLDVHGRAFVALNMTNEVARVSPGGATRILASGDPLDFPSSLAFGTTAGERRTLYGVSFSIGEMFGQPAGPGPSLWTLRVGSVGVLMP